MRIRFVTITILGLFIVLASSVSALELSGRKVVLDPGHGGSDPGALGYNGATYPDEADFNLTVGLKVRTLLQNAGCTVVMTRSTDAYLTLSARLSLVNSENPDCSLCVHCNSFSDASAHGTETYWCSSSCSGDSAADQDLATKVQSRLVQFLGRTSRGVKRYDFTMCTPIPPSCLAEMLFVSNLDEFNLINTAAGQDSAAAAFLYAVLDRIGVVDPSTPGGLTATAASASQINLSWTDNSGIEDSYKIERATASGGPWTEIATTAANATSCASTGLSSGTTYYHRVRAYDATLGSSAYSGTASATTQVSGAPSITLQPVSQTVNPGTTVSFTVVATGNPTLTYQWQRNNVSLTDGGKISGATAATLTITNVQQTDVGNYTVVVANSVDSVTSASAALTVNAVIAFYEDFESGLGNWTNFVSPATALTSSTAQAISNSYSAYVDGSWDRMYRNLGIRVDGRLRITAWVYDSTQTRSFVDVRGYSGGSYNNGDLVQLFCAGKYNSVTMSGETWDNTKYQGRVVAGAYTGWFNLNAAGAPSRSTGWHKFVIERRADGTTVDFYVDDVLSRTITGASLGSLDSAAIGSVGSGTSNVAGDSWIDAVKVEYFDLPVITTEPTSRTNTAGSTATFTVVAANTVGGYQWRKNGANLVNGGNISGATTATLTINNVQDSDVASYDVVVSNGAGPVNSATATLSVSPAITSQPANQINNAGTTATFTVAAAGQLPLGFQWRKDGVALENGGRIDGATTDTLLIANVAPADEGNYTVVVNNAAGSVTSVVATLTIAQPPVITVQPVSQAVAAGDNVTFSATLTGTPPLAYQWRLNEAPIPGATGTSLSLTNVQAADAGNYSVEVTNIAGAVISDNATLTVNNSPILSALSNQTVHAGATVTAAAVASDMDAGQTLIYSLGAGAPTNAVIGATSGLFSWPTTDADAGTATPITINVADNGTPSLSDATTFTITVASRLVIQTVALAGTNVVLTWTAISGKTYRVEHTDNLETPTWGSLSPDVTASGLTASMTDPLGVTQRFYRIVCLN